MQKQWHARSNGICSPASAVDLQRIIDDIADQADEFLATASNRAQARAGIEELLTAEHSALAAGERAQVVAGVMAILENEGFFEGLGAAGGPKEDEDDGGE